MTVKKIPLMIPSASSDGHTEEVRNPYNNELLATVETADQAAVDTALETAFNLFNNRNEWLPKKQRIKILTTAASIMEIRIEELTLEAAQEGGKPLADSRVEVLRAIDGVRGCVDCMRTGHGREIPMNINAASENRLAVTSHEPIGVVVAVSAFNHPLNLIVHQVGPAIAAGNPVIVKPAGDTPISCFNFISILREAGLPDAWCQPLATRSRDVSEALVTDKRVSFFSFIGSGRVGWMLRSKLAAGARCSLEHGGVAPVILTKNADLDAMLPLLTKGGLYHAGQVCVSVQRVFCEKDIAYQVATKLAELAKQMKVGDPSEEATEIGPIIRPEEIERIHQWVTEAKDAGAEILCGGEILANNCYAPTIIYNPDKNLKVSKLEIFGPVVCVFPWDNIDEAIQLANSLPYAFQASVMTKDIDLAFYASKRLNASAVMINDHTAFRVDWMPFAGLRESGLGVGGIPYSYHDMQVEKLIVVRSSAPTTLC